MKILLFGPAYPLRGGMAHFIAMLYTHLTKRGHDVLIISFTRQYPKILFPGKTQEESGDAGTPVPSTALIDSINPLNWIIQGIKLRKQNADLVISTFWIPFLAPSSGTLHALLRTKKTKTLTILHNLIPHEKRLGDMLFTRWLMRFTDYFIAQSASVEKDLLSLLPSAKYKRVALPMFDLFHNRIPKAEARKQLAITDEKVIMFFGYIRPYKGLHILIDAMKIVKQKINIRLLVCGEYYGDEEKYRRHIKEAGIEDVTTVFSDYIPNEKVHIFFSAADVVVQPYISATQSAIAQIAYFFSSPIIATNVGALPEVVINEKSGLIVPPNNPQQLADAILRFYNEQMEAKLTAGASEERKKYTWDAMVDAIEQLTLKG
ncbi:MAG: glycosyltransferase family 4 protein [Bacteroidota bacterium]|nr:glycosyltransferase family 4 protein [Bacteroidota bacterium]